MMCVLLCDRCVVFGTLIVCEVLQEVAQLKRKVGDAESAADGLRVGLEEAKKKLDADAKQSSEAIGALNAVGHRGCRTSGVCICGVLRCALLWCTVTSCGICFVED